VPVVNAVTKAKIPNRDDPILIKMNYCSLIDDENENESLVNPFDLMRHNIKVDMMPPQHGGRCGITFDNIFILLQYDDEKLYMNIIKPKDEDLELLEWFEINSPEEPFFFEKNKIHRK